MAEIKSSLEIALERAAAMGGGSASDLALDEAREKGRVAARKVLGGMIEPDGINAELAGLKGEALTAAQKAAAEKLMEDLPQTAALTAPALLALAGDKAQGVLQALDQFAEVERSLAAKLAKEMASDLSEAGYNGPALCPNPKAHPDYKARRKSALAKARAQLEHAGREFVSIL